MAKKKLYILLEKDVPQVGQRGEVKQVAQGYALNFLVPKGYARLATPEIIAQVQQAKAKQQKAHQQAVQMAQKLAKQLQDQTFEIQAKAGPEGKLFGSVGEKDILARLSQEGLEVDQVKLLSQPIKQVGEHRVELDLGHGQKAQLKIIVKPAPA